MAALLMILPNREYYRWQQGDGAILFRARYVYERIHYDPRPIDVAMVGSSRMEASVRVNELSEGLSRKLGRQVSVVNFGLPQEGRDLQWAVVEQLLSNRSEVKLIVLSAGAESTLSHPGFRFLGDDASIVGAPAFYNPYYLENLLTLPYRRLAYFVQGLWPEAFQLSPSFDRIIHQKRAFDPAESFRMPNGELIERERVLDPSRIEAQRRAIAETRKHDPKLRYLGLDQRYAIERSYLRKIARLTKEKGVDVAFLRVPVYQGADEQIDDRKFYTSLGPILEPVQLAGDYRHYMDAGHLNRTGTAALSPWLVEQLTQLLLKAERNN